MADRRTESLMGTVFSFDVRTPGFPVVELDRVVDWLRWVDATFSTYRADSSISRLARGDLTLDQCAPEVGEVLDLCQQAYATTEGYFSAQYNGLLDPTGLVKGWAIERTSALLQAAGSSSHAINGGGDVRTVGGIGPGCPWRIGIAHPFEAGALAAVVSGRDTAVATSGTAERGRHILDPFTGRAATAWASVTVVGTDLARADAYATAAVAMGEHGIDWLTDQLDHEAIAVHADGHVACTPGVMDHPHPSRQ